MVNASHVGCSIENAGTFQELPEKSTISGKRKRKLLLKIVKKESKKLESFKKLLDAEEPEPIRARRDRGVK